MAMKDTGERLLGHPVFAEEKSDASTPGHDEAVKQKLRDRFIELLRQALKTNPGTSWVVESWGGIRGEHPEWQHRLTPMSLVVWAATGQQPHVRDEIGHLDKLGFESVSLGIGEAIESDDDTSRMGLRSKILHLI